MLLTRVRELDAYEKGLDLNYKTQKQKTKERQSRADYLGRIHTLSKHQDYALRSLSSESSGELEVLGLDGNTLGVDGGKVG